MERDSNKSKAIQKTRKEKLKTSRSQKCLGLSPFQTKRKFLAQIKTTESSKKPNLYNQSHNQGGSSFLTETSRVKSKTISVRGVCLPNNKARMKNSSSKNKRCTRGVH
jgi:hypothetical protein